MGIPIDLAQPAEKQSHLIQFDDTITISVPVTDMPSLLPKPMVRLKDAANQDHLLHLFMQLKNKINYEHAGQYYKSYFGKHEGIYCFVYKHHPNSKHKEWGVPLPDLPNTWTDL